MRGGMQRGQRMEKVDKGKKVMKVVKELHNVAEELTPQSTGGILIDV